MEGSRTVAPGCTSLNLLSLQPAAVWAWAVCMCFAQLFWVLLAFFFLLFIIFFFFKWSSIQPVFWQLAQGWKLILCTYQSTILQPDWNPLNRRVTWTINNTNSPYFSMILAFAGCADKASWRSMGLPPHCPSLLAPLYGARTTNQQDQKQRKKNVLSTSIRNAVCNTTTIGNFSVKTEEVMSCGRAGKARCWRVEIC